jgi:AraC family transcriptional regulator
MALTFDTLASGPGWQVNDFVCTAGPHDKPFEEQHAAASIAIVTAGTFRYRTGAGDALLAPGALLLGNRGACFECGHEHSTGDRCLSFHVTERFLEAVASARPGVRRTTFSAPRLPPLPQLAPLLAQAETAREERDAGALEEIALRLTGAVLATLADAGPSRHSPSPRDIERVTEALRRIDAAADQRISVAQLARDACMSAYHFLRTFRHVVGMTPHQYVLRTRLHRAALALRRSDQPVSAVALDAGFEDLSTFNRRFRRVMGVTPSVFRAQ